MAEAPTPGSALPETDRLFDEYVEACLQGAPEDPTTFLDRHGIRDPDLLRRLAGLCDMAAGGADIDAPPFAQLGAYELTERLGEGGMGAVYLARHVHLGRRVALKVIRPELRASDKAVRRFRREAQAVARLRHPSIVRLQDFGRDQGVLFFAMELVRGRPLSEIVREAPPPPQQAARWAREVARALHYAHSQGIVHRDVKPSNVPVTAEGRPVLLDFGVAHLLETEGTRLTTTFAGSPSYAAPEQISAEYGAVDGRTDVYGLGATLYECLTGHPPFEGGTVQSVFRRVLTEDPTSPRHFRPSLSAAYSLVTLKALEKKPEDRYPSAEAMAEDLDALRRDHAVRARSPGPLRRIAKWSRRHPIRATVAATVLVAAGILAAFLIVQRWEDRHTRRNQARLLMAEARSRVDDYRERRQAMLKSERAYIRLSGETRSRYFSEADDAELGHLAATVRHERRAREGIHYEVLRLVQEAERLDPGVEGADDVVGRLHVERLFEARQEGDGEAVALHEEIIERLDPTGRLLDGARREGRLCVYAEPAGTEVFLFSSRLQSDVVENGDARRVPVPFGDEESPARRGSWALEVLRSNASIQAGDLILEVAGHPIRGAMLAAGPWGRVRRGDRLLRIADAKGVDRRARSRWDVEEYLAGARRLIFERRGEGIDVMPTDAGLSLGALSIVDAAALVAAGDVEVDIYRFGTRLRRTARAGLCVRTTAAPRFLSATCRVGRAPLELGRVSAGPYEVVLRPPGRMPVSYGVRIDGGETWTFKGRLPRTTKAPEGWRYVATYASLPRGDGVVDVGSGFWMMEHEVTCREYVAFLNEPATREEIARAEEEGRTIRVPRNLEDGGRGSRWPRNRDGTYEFGEGRDPEWPVLGVSYDDAIAYARWLTERDGRSYALPTLRHWWAVCYGSARGQYVFGDVFRPKWMKSCYARPRARPEAVMSFPVDRSVHGVYDLSGSAAEWLDVWYDEERGLRRLAGGAWALVGPERFAIEGAEGQPPGAATEYSGFRLVLPGDTEW